MIALGTCNKMPSFRREFRIGTFDFQQREIRWHIIRAGLHTDFQKRRRRTACQISHGMPSIVPSAGDLQSACSAEVAMPADPPEDHLDEHTVVDLYEQIFDNPAACVRVEHRKRGAAPQARMRVSQPG